MGCPKLRLWLLFSILFLPAEALPYSPPEYPGCRLDFSWYPYRPIGGCNDVKESLKDWSGFPKTRCCQNALIVFSHALALRSRTTGNIFLSQDEWNSCGGLFKLQPNVSIQTCGFGNFYLRSSVCSTVKLAGSDRGDFIQKCSSFDTSSFDNACESCTSAILTTVDKIMADFKLDASNVTEKAMCLVNVLVVFIAAKQNGTFGIDDFNRCLPALAIPGRKNYIQIRNDVAEALLAVILVIIALASIITLIKYMSRSQKKEKKYAVSQNIEACSGLYKFSKAEIKNAMNYGSEKKYLGRGSAGQVYKGLLPSGQPVAIKQIYKSNPSDSSFTREIEGLSRVRHPNLVSLFGCCFEDGEHYLVYEYCPKGNLAQHLRSKANVLMWESRVKILRDCAFALKYLHNHIDGCIVHRDIKLTNILLTHKMEPKLSDFGLAKMLRMEESKVFTDVRGTIGYMDPEYMSNAKLTSASDVYSFGIVTLQILSGQRVIELDLEARDQLTRKAKDVNMGKRPLTDFQDPSIQEDVVSVDFESILQIAVLCVASSSAGRPTIDVVFDELEKVWKNTELVMKARKKNISEASPSKSQELIEV